MSLWNSISHLVTDPPPAHIFELSEAGMAYAHGGRHSFEPFPPGTIQVSPVENNIVRGEVVSSMITRLASANSGKKRRPAAVLLPDLAVRVSVLDFDSFPDNPEEQASLVRFRVKKTIPFEIESAAVN